MKRRAPIDFDEVFSNQRDASLNVPPEVGPRIAMFPTDSGSLAEAARSGHCARIRELTRSGALLNATHDLRRQTPLMIAVITEQTEAFHLLLEAGANPLPADIHGKTALIYAIEKHSQVMVNALVRAGASLQPLWMAHGPGASPLTFALSLGYYDIAELLLSHGAPPTPSLTAGGCGLRTEQVQFLLDVGADPSAMLTSKLHFASIMFQDLFWSPEWLSTLTLLLSHGWDLNQRHSSGSHTLFHYFVQSILPQLSATRAETVLRLMIVYGADYRSVPQPGRAKMLQTLTLPPNATDECVVNCIRRAQLVKIS